MKKGIFTFILSLVLTNSISAQEQLGGVMSFNVPAKNSLRFNKFLINPTFSFAREDESFLTVIAKRQYTGFDDAPSAYFVSYSGLMGEQNGTAIGVFQRNEGLLTAFGAVANFTRNVEINRDSNFSFGLNLAYINSGLNTGKIVSTAPDPTLESVPKNSLITIIPGVNYSFGFVDIGLSLNNIFTYNLSNTGAIADDPNKGISGHFMYTGYIDRYSGMLENMKFSLLAKADMYKAKTQFSGGLMLNAPNGFWVQGSYHSINGLNGGLGFVLAKRMSLGYSVDKGLGNFNNFGLSHEITLAYKIEGYGDYKVNKVKMVKATAKTNAYQAKPTNPKPTAEELKQKREALAAELKQRQQDRIQAEKQRREKLLADLKAKQEANASAKGDLAKKRAEEQKALLDAKAKADAEAREKALADSKAKAEADALAKAEAERKVKEEAESRAKAEAARLAELERQRKAKELADADAKAKAKAEEAARLKAEQERLAKEKAEADAKAKADAAARAKEEADRIAREKADAARSAKEKADAEAKAKAEEAARLKAEQERLAKEKAEADAKAKADAAARAKEEADRIAREKADAARSAKEKADAEAKAKAEEAARLKAEQERLAKEKAEADAKAKADAAARAKEEADRIAREKADAARLAKEKADAEAKAKAEEALRLKAEQERLAKEKADAEAKAKADEAERLRKEAEEKAKFEASKMAEDKEIDNLTQVIDDSKKLQASSLNKFKDVVTSKEKELLELRRENDLSEQGVAVQPKEVEFQSSAAANRALESLKAEITQSANDQDRFIKEFEALAAERLKKVPNKQDAVNISYANALAKLKADKLAADKENATLVAKLEQIKTETEIEKKRRIKRAQFDSSADKYKKDRQALQNIKATTTPTGQAYTPADFNFGEDDQANMQIVKKIENLEEGFYLVVAVHKDEAKRDEFLKKAIQAGQTNIDFFYNVATSKYYIYYQKYYDIQDATKALETKGNKPYNGKMVIVKVEK